MQISQIVEALCYTYGSMERGMERGMDSSMDSSMTTLNAFLRQILMNGFEAGEDIGSIPDWQQDPEKVDYIRVFFERIYEGRSIAASYNLVVLVVILLFSVLHFRDTVRDRKKWIQRLAGLGSTPSEGKAVDGVARRACRRLGNDGGEVCSSSSSSTLAEADAMPPMSQYANNNVDLERRPLLQRRTLSGRSGSRRGSIFRIVAAWLTYQPCTLPLVNRKLPSNGTSLFVLAFISLNISLHFYRLPFEAKFFFLFADRSGYMFIVNLPLLYLLAAKTQPLKFFTGRSYEALNIFHRRLGELLCVEFGRAHGQYAHLAPVPETIVASPGFH